MWVIPTFFGLKQDMIGHQARDRATVPTAVTTDWGPYSSNPYGDLFVKP